MLINKSNLDSIFIQFDLRFQQAYQGTPNWWDKVASLAPSGSRETHYGWIGRLPALRSWVGERQVKNLQARGYVLANNKFEDTIGVPREQIEDDQIGVYAGYLDGLGRAAKVWPDQIVTTAIQNGNSSTLGLCFDGQAFFNNSHPIDMDNTASATYQNNFDATAGGGSASTPLQAANYQLVRQTMVGYLGEDSVPLGIVPNLLMTPPQLEAQAMQIIKAELIAPSAGFGINAAQAQSNVLLNTCQYLMNPYLANQSTVWYLMDVSRAIKPFIFQLRNAPEFVFLNRLEDPNAFLRDEFLYGVRARGAAGVTLPFLCARAAQ